MIDEELLQTFKQKLEERNANDYLSVLVSEFDGFLGNYLMRKQMLKDNACDDPDCLHCNPDREFEDDLIN